MATMDYVRLPARQPNKARGKQSSKPQARHELEYRSHGTATPEFAGTQAYSYVPSAYLQPEEPTSDEVDQPEYQTVTPSQLESLTDYDRLMSNLNQDERRHMNQLLISNGAYTFSPFFHSRNPRYTTLLTVCNVFSSVFLFAIAIVAIVVVLGEQDINLSAFLFGYVIIFGIFIGVMVSLVFLEFYRSNNDLSPRYKHHMFMPLVVQVIVFILTTVCLGVYCTRENCEIDRNDFQAYTSLTACLILCVIGVPMLVRETASAIYASQYPEGSSPRKYILLGSRAEEIHNMMKTWDERLGATKP